MAASVGRYLYVSIFRCLLDVSRSLRLQQGKFGSVGSAMSLFYFYLLRVKIYV